MVRVSGRHEWDTQCCDEKYSSAPWPVGGEIKERKWNLKKKPDCESLDQHWISRPMNLEVLFINLTTSPIHHLKLKYCPSHIAVGRREQSRQGEGGPGQRQEIPMQHELFSSIVPPEQLFVPQPPPRHKLQRPHPLLGLCLWQPSTAVLWGNRTATTTVKETIQNPYTHMQFTCGPLLSSAGGWRARIKKLGVPLQLSPKSLCG